MGRDFTPYQRGIVNRYYEHKTTIHATKLGEIVSDISIETDAKKLEKMWKSAAEYLGKCGVEPGTVQAIAGPRDVKLLAEAAGLIMTGKPVPKRIPKA